MGQAKWTPMSPALARMMALEQMARTHPRHDVSWRSRLARAVARFFAAG